MKYTKLITSGCSFTFGKYSWGKTLADYLNVEWINLAMSGAGNQHINASIRLYLEQNQIDPKTTLIGIMWSGINRRDWIVSCQEKYNDLHRYVYTDSTRLVIPSEALHKYQVSQASLKQLTDPDLLEIAYAPGGDAMSLNGWLAIDHLNSYLTTKNFKFFQTAFYDHTNNSPDPKTIFTGINYNTNLKKLNLTLDDSNWLNFNGNNLGNWSHDQGLISDHHPTFAGHVRWTKEILIPKLIDQRLVDPK